MSFLLYSSSQLSLHTHEAEWFWLNSGLIVEVTGIIILVLLTRACLLLVWPGADMLWLVPDMVTRSHHTSHLICLPLQICKMWIKWVCQSRIGMVICILTSRVNLKYKVKQTLKSLIVKYLKKVKWTILMKFINSKIWCVHHK